MPKEAPPAPAVVAVEPPAPVELPELAPDVLAALLERYADDPDKRAALAPRLKSNRFVAGIVGERIQAERELADAEAARKAIATEHENLRKMAKDDPLAFSETWLSKDDVDAEKAKTAGLRAATRKEFITAIGNALKDLPEASEFTADDRNQIATKLLGLDEDAVIPAFNRLYTDMIATKRAEKLSAAAIDKRLAAERKVWDAEQRTARLKQRQAPDTLTPPAPSANGQGAEPADSNSKEWDQWYRTNVLRRPGRVA